MQRLNAFVPRPVSALHLAGGATYKLLHGMCESRSTETLQSMMRLRQVIAGWGFFTAVLCIDRSRSMTGFVSALLAWSLHFSAVSVQQRCPADRLFDDCEPHPQTDTDIYLLQTRAITL